MSQTSRSRIIAAQRHRRGHVRGSLLHAQQRRERARTHVHITVVLPGLIEGVEIEGTLTV